MVSGPGTPGLKERLEIWTPGSVCGEAGGPDAWAEGGRDSYTTNQKMGLLVGCSKGGWV